MHDNFMSRHVKREKASQKEKLPYQHDYLITSTLHMKQNCRDGKLIEKLEEQEKLKSRAWNTKHGKSKQNEIKAVKASHVFFMLQIAI